MSRKDLFPKDNAKPRKAYRGEDLPFQLIDGNGFFNNEGLKDFAKQAKFERCGRSYAIVAIMGPQSSGKSTLLNHLFGTNFKMMDDSEGRSQTTLGIWLARCPDIKPLTLVMDMEGSDGSERGEDDTSFEKQSALFALAVADVVLINMWCQDIGREHGANKPLLRTVFQQVLIQFSKKPRKITLMFVVRDKTKSPEHTLEAKLREDIEKVWASILKPSGCSNLRLQDFFKVEVVFLPNYEEKEQDFKSKVQFLKQRFNDSTARGGLAYTGEGKEPASAFLVSAPKIWNDILGNRDLDLPAQKIMVATARCEEIKNEQYNSFQMNVELQNLRKVAQIGFVPDFVESVNSVLDNCVSKYDAETANLDKDVANEKREELIHQCLQLVEHVYQAKVNRLRLEHLEKFMKAIDKGSEDQNKFNTVADYIQYCLLEFDKGCAAIKVDRAKWDSLKARAKLRRDMKSYAATKREDKPAFLIRRFYEPKLKKELSESTGYFLCEAEEIDPTWSMIRDNFKTIMESSLFQLDETLSELGVNEERRKEMSETISQYAKDIVGAKGRVESGRAKSHMIRRYNDDSSPRNWNNSEEIEGTAKTALSTPLKLLACLAANRLEEPDEDNNILKILSSALLERDQIALKELDASEWKKVPHSMTLITPIQCKELWGAFKVEVDNAVNGALELLQPSVNGDPLNQSGQEHLNKSKEAFDKHSVEQNAFTSAADDCTKNRIMKTDNLADVKIEHTKKDTEKTKAKHQRDMNTYNVHKHEEKLASVEAKLKGEIPGYVEYLLCEETDPTWSKIRNFLGTKIQLTCSELDHALSEFSIDEADRQKGIERIRKYAKDLIINKAKEESSNARTHMIKMFEQLLKKEYELRGWRVDAPIIEAALLPPLKVLTGLVAIRLEESDTDNIEDILLSTLSQLEGSNTPNALDYPNWEEVPLSRTLITPSQCKQLLKDYQDDIDKVVNKIMKNLKLKKNPSTENYRRKGCSLM